MVFWESVYVCEEAGRETKKVGDGTQIKEGASRFDVSAAKLTCFEKEQSNKGGLVWFGLVGGNTGQ
jgi:hypothetical protein